MWVKVLVPQNNSLFWNRPRLISQAHSQPAMKAPGLITPPPLPSKRDAFISIVPYHTATE